MSASLSLPDSLGGEVGAGAGGGGGRVELGMAGTGVTLVTIVGLTVVGPRGVSVNPVMMSSFTSSIGAAVVMTGAMVVGISVVVGAGVVVVVVSTCWGGAAFVQDASKNVARITFILLCVLSSLVC